MGKKLEGLVEYYSEDQALLGRCQAAVEWLADTPEGMQLMRDAQKLHGKPVVIWADPEANINTSGLMVHKGQPLIRVSPDAIESASYQTMDGKAAPFNLRRFFAHEFTHATQPLVIENTQAATRKKAQIHMELRASIKPPMDQYRGRLQAARKDTKKLAAIFAEMYDGHVRPKAEQSIPELTRRAALDEDIKRYVEEYEAPAIEKENEIMRAHANEPGRTTDYAQSGHFDERAWEHDREQFIRNGLAFYASAQGPGKARREGH